MRRVGVALVVSLAVGPAWAAPGAGGAGLGAGVRAIPPAAQPSPPAVVHAAGQTPATAPASKPLVPTDPIAARYSTDYEGCMHKAGSTLDMVTCADHENERWDARMNRALQSRLGAFNDHQRTALKRAQKAWTEFREADCAAYEDDDAGSISRIDASQCVLRRTVERTLELEAFPVDHGPG